MQSFRIEIVPLISLRLILKLGRDTYYRNHAPKTDPIFIYSMKTKNLLMSMEFSKSLPSPPGERGALFPVSNNAI